MLVVLNKEELAEIFRQDPATKKDGGFQSLFVSLQEKCDKLTGELDLNSDDLKRIPMYAFDYENGGWESRLILAFSRHLGPKLGR